MTYNSTTHWTIADENVKCGLLLFAQSLEELLSIHSHDSHKVPALNFHHICFEISHTIDLIETDVLEKGNLIPLIAEMRTLFHQDWVAQKFLGSDFEAIFFNKNSNGDYEKKPLKIENSKDIDAVLPQLKKKIRFIIGELERKNQYYLELINESKKQIKDCGNDLEKLEFLLSLTKIIASELINQGFNQSYIYDCINQTFFSPQYHVDSLESVDKFFNYFSSSQRKYSVYLPINSIKQKKALDDYGVFKFAENVYEMFNSSIPYILKYECEASDPYNARENTLDLINFCLAVNQFIKHNKYDFYPRYAEVLDKESCQVTSIQKPEPAIVRGNTNAVEIELNDLLQTCFDLSVSIFQILQLHSAALTSKNPSNQLINLWTAMEVAVPVIRKDGLSRINQISNVLTSILSENYFATLIHQLLLDIKAADSTLLDNINGIEYDGSLELKLSAIIVLQKYTDTFEEISTKLSQSVPLLACRMQCYKNRWSTTQKLKESYRAHVERLSQQIMRIYRTRNMLVHDGSSLLYSDYVLQNLQVDCIMKLDT